MYSINWMSQKKEYLNYVYVVWDKRFGLGVFSGLAFFCVIYVIESYVKSQTS